MSSSTNPVIRGNSLYAIVDGPSWTEAKQIANEAGGYLASITSEEEFNFLHQKDFKGWIGLSDPSNNGPVNSDGSRAGWGRDGFSWESGEAYRFESWMQPVFNIDGNYVHFWDGHGGNTVLLATDEVLTNHNTTWWDGKGIAEIPFIRRGDSAYVIVEGPTWEEAEANANALGGHLVTINDAGENEWITKSFGRGGEYNFKGSWKLWIGLNKKNAGEKLEWISGDDLSFEFFHQGTSAYSNDSGWGYAFINIPSTIVSFERNDGVWVPHGDHPDYDGIPMRGLAEIPLAPNNIPTGTPTLTGDFKVGQTISIDASAIEDADNFDAWTPTYEYSWEVSNDNGSSWTTLTSADATDGDNSFTLKSVEVGKQLRGVVSYLDGYGSTETLASSAELITDTPQPTSAPVPTPAPEPEPTPATVPTLTGDPPNLIKATLRGKNITLQFDNILSDTLPSNGRFTLNQNNREYEIVDTETSASEGIVRLTVEKELDPTVTLTLDYLDFAGDQTTGVIESATGVDLESFTGFSLNNQGSQENSLTIDEGEFEGNQITLFLSAPISDAIPSKRRFKVKSANKKQKLLGVTTEPDDGIVVLTTKKNLDLQESVFVSYRDLGGDQVDKVLEDLAGNDMATISNFEIASGGNDAIAPTVESATLDENTLSVEFDSIIRNTEISKNRFKVKVNGKKVRVLSATVEQDDSYVELALKPKNLRTIDINSSVTLSYKDPKGDQTSKVVEDIFGNDLDSFNGFGVEIVKI